MVQYPESTMNRMGLLFCENQLSIHDGAFASKSRLALMVVSSHHVFGLNTGSSDLRPLEHR